MSEVDDKSLELQDQEIRRRNVGAGEKFDFEDSSDNLKPDNLSPVDSDNEQRLGSDSAADSDRVKKNFIDFFTI